MRSLSTPSKTNTPTIDGDSFVPFDHAAAGHVHHPAFKAYMPTFMGSLSAIAKNISDLAPLELKEVVNSSTSSGTDTPLPLELAVKTETVSPLKPSTDWVPSGGKKLDTGLSIVLENITDGFVRPNVLDVKLGARLWADDAVPDKRAKLDAVSEKTTSGSLGFRIAGMKVWLGEDKTNNPAQPIVKTAGIDTPSTAAIGKAQSKMEIVDLEGYRRYDKWYGRSFTEHDVIAGFQTFLTSAKLGKVDRSALIAKRLAQELRSIQAVLEGEESRMYSASILIVYEGDSEAFETALEEEASPKSKASTSSDETGPTPTEIDGINEELVADNGIEHISVTLDPSKVEMTESENEDDDDPKKLYDIRIIDFAHASWTPGQGPDNNALMGVRNLAQIMEKLAGAAT
ncbi:hypothetical protein FQN57_003209 [Myotisia sp. PD_48]|nr:hypothetical protein FQN57_003209 [Myotisia sp. PD_48]